MKKDSFDINKFDINKSTFIEASAGTGKTFTIKTIVRKIVEDGTPLDKILIVTYTEKAAGELKSRIRDELSTLTDKDFDVDNAPIFTIHSFCKNTLDQYAFTADQPLQLDLIDEDDVADFIELLVRDQLPKNDEFKALVQGNSNPANFIEELESFFSSAINSMYLNSKGDLDPNIITIDEACKKIYDCTSPREFLECIDSNYPAKFSQYFAILAAPSFTSDKTIEKIVKTLDNWRKINPWNEIQDPLKGIGPTTIGPITEKYKNNKDVLEALNFFSNLKSEVAEIKKESINKDLYKFYASYLPELCKKWQEYKAKNKVQTYNDMIRNVREAVLLENSPLLKVLQDQYKYAIIDEFQDTNQKQWDIFKTIFLTQDHAIYVVGDPKQSIYAFQGADINVYNQAKNDIKDYMENTNPGQEFQAWDLDTNYRSTDPMVEVCNKIFEEDQSQEKNFFQGQPEIEFTPSNPSHKKATALFDGKEVKPLWLFNLIEGTDENSFIEAAIQKIVQCCQLVNGKSRLQIHNKAHEDDKKEPEYRNVSFKDFTVLARTRSEIKIMESHLKHYGIPFTRYKDTNLFSGMECAQWVALFKAIDTDDFTGFKRKILNEALYTKFFNVPLTQKKDNTKAPVESKIYDSIITSQERKLLVEWKKLAQDRLWAKLIESIFIYSELEESLADLSNLQSLSKFRQIGNYAVDYLYQHNCSLNDLIRHLSRLLNKDKDEDSQDENLIARGTDFDCLQLMTIHASKGLEFPIVISLAGFKNYWRPANTCYLYHDSKKKLTISFAKFRGKRTKNENLLEWQRLFYVCYTRASSIMMIGLYDSWKDSVAFSFLDESIRPLYSDYDGTDKDVISYQNNDANIIIKTDENYKPKEIVKEILSATGKNINIDDEDSREKKQRASFDDLISNEKEIVIHKYNYSNLTHTTKEESSEKIDVSKFDKEGQALPANYDPSIERPLIAEKYPAGTRLGEAIHKIFEISDFTRFEDKEYLSEKIIHSFNTFAFKLDKEDKDKWLEQTLYFVQNTLQAQIPEIVGNEARENYIKLKNISFANRLSEADFNMNPEFGKLMQNYCNGAIDLIFRHEVDGKQVYSIVDWKTDQLKTDDEEAVQNLYGDKAFLKNHVDRHYSIQRVLYSYALIKWISPFYNESEEEVFKKYFGGVYYVLIRGTSADTSNGIYAQTWDSWDSLKKAFETICKKRMK
ncbi:MAG: UvrD-helicase domain-containing protein [Treponema sp.]|nr:UvrD-helicase domain-containing protein [Treponema sp.]